jgi:amyotrophic lateral sclerosis 2 protein
MKVYAADLEFSIIYILTLFHMPFVGDFSEGKCNGFGKFRSLKNMEFTNYVGYFTNDTFNGFGALQTQTYQYKGDFQADNKEGFGVLEDNDSGSKYIGMFFNNKKQGPGILITTNGHYYAGNFVNDGLSTNAEGLAIFPSGMYYRGELTIEGPYGRGTFYYPEKEIASEFFEMDDTNVKVQGHIVTGSFSGTWENVSIDTIRIRQNTPFLCFILGKIIKRQYADAANVQQSAHFALQCRC